jgi:nitrite reductase/ring-hydroxylating ferredoxin subunit
MSESFVKIGSLGDFPDGSMRKVHVHDEDVLVANISGKIYAIGDECTHRACSLSEGTIEDTVVTCPCHGGRFDLTTGKVIGPPPERGEPSYEVQLQDSNVLIKKR